LPLPDGSGKREHRNREKTPEGNLPFSLSHLLQSPKKNRKAFGTTIWEPLLKARKGKPDVAE
jgi:hypothetical protein